MVPTPQPVPGGTWIVATVAPEAGIDAHHRGRVSPSGKPERALAALAVRPLPDGGAERTGLPVDMDHFMPVLPPDPEIVADELRIDRVRQVDREFDGTRRRIQSVELPGAPARHPQTVVGPERRRVIRRDRCRKVVDRAGRAVDPQDLALPEDPDRRAIGCEADHSSRRWGRRRRRSAPRAPT